MRPGIPVRTAGIITRAGTRDWLLVRSPKGSHGWMLPGGHVAPGEAPSDTIVREIAEELGFDLHHPMLRIITWTSPATPDRPGNFTYVFDMGSIPADAPVIPDPAEIGAWQWVDRALVPQQVQSTEADRLQRLLDSRNAEGLLYVEQVRPRSER
jgi:8-oxo-dGTP pyrophosphatase MutT (NUDIX family)